MSLGGRVAVAAIATIALAAAAPASGAVSEGVFTVKGAPAPGPDRFDQVLVHRFGPRSAKRVLVLMPGTQGGAGDFTIDGRWLASHVKGLQVWAIDRRTYALEDTSIFEQGLAGRRSPQEVFDYYLGWITGATPPSHYNFVDTSQLGFTREWGMKVALDDARRVVKLAREGGRRVILGGHSLGASLTVAYAAWDFNGRPGYKDLDGLVLIDGGLLGSFDAYDLAQAREQITALQSASPFLDLLGTGIPEAAGLFAEVGGLFAKLDPTGDGSILQNYPLLPPDFKPAVPATNRAILGYAFDRDSSPPSLGLLHVNAGGLAESGTPRDWVDGGVTPVANLADTFAQEPTNAVEWFFPTRLTIDTNGADQMRMNDVGRFLGLRLEHTRQVDLPLYAFQTDLADAHVLDGARAFVKRSATSRGEAVLVNRDPQTSHLDPLTAAPPANDFLRTVKPFLAGAFGR